MCNEKEETIHHIVSGCSNLAQKEYKRRHDCVARALHWDILRQRGFKILGTARIIRQVLDI